MSPRELEKQTRRERINPRLEAAGWEVIGFEPRAPRSAYEKTSVEEFETANGPADYALCNDGRVLGVVEAKKVTLGPQGVLAKAFRGELILASDQPAATMAAGPKSEAP